MFHESIVGLRRSHVEHRMGKMSGMAYWSVENILCEERKGTVAKVVLGVQHWNTFCTAYSSVDRSSIVPGVATVIKYA